LQKKWLKIFELFQKSSKMITGKQSSISHVHEAWLLTVLGERDAIHQCLKSIENYCGNEF